VMADSLAVIACGALEEEIKELTAKLVTLNETRDSSIIGRVLRTEPSKAALINGAAGTFLELDEGHRFARGHPAMHVMPAALAIAEKKNLSGKKLLNAFILGYEIGTRIGIACNLPISMQSHGTWGTVGASIAVAKLMGYTREEMKQIINVSSSLSLATSRRTALEGATVRNAYTGVSGHMGILAHQLVQSGFTGESDGLRSVFGNVVSDTFSPELMIDGLGHRFEILRNYFKLHACCRYNHATLDALSSIIDQRQGRRILPNEVVKVEVITYSLAAQLSDQNPKNMRAGKFSIPFAVSSFIVHGSAGVESFTSQAINDPLIRALAQRVEVLEDPQLSAMLPDHRPSRVRVTLTDGTILEAHVLSNKGDKESPYSQEELRTKYFKLARKAWDLNVAEAIHDAVMNLDKLDNVNLMTNWISPVSKTARDE
jgi:2-methylcitrate dehydratase PrpD